MRLKKNIRGPKANGVATVRMQAKGRLYISKKYGFLFEENDFCYIDVFDDEIVITSTNDSEAFKIYKSRACMVITCVALCDYLPLKELLTAEARDGKLVIKRPEK